MFRNLVTCVALLLALPAISIAQETGKATADKEVHCTYAKEKQKTCGVACSVNFARELGLSLDYLGSIGHRIAQARKASDPVELALCSQALSVAEKVSGKQAAVTANQVQQEALEIARLRGNSQELSAVALIVSSAAADLDKQIALAKKREAEAKASIDAKEDQKELVGRLIVANHSDECLRIYVSGNYVGEVHAGQAKQFHVHDHNNPTTLEAYCEEDGEQVSSKHVFGHRHFYNWCIH